MSKEFWEIDRLECLLKPQSLIQIFLLDLIKAHGRRIDNSTMILLLILRPFLRLDNLPLAVIRTISLFQKFRARLDSSRRIEDIFSVAKGLVEVVGALGYDPSLIFLQVTKYFCLLAILNCLSNSHGFHTVGSQIGKSKLLLFVLFIIHLIIHQLLCILVIRIVTVFPRKAQSIVKFLTIPTISFLIFPFMRRQQTDLPLILINPILTSKNTLGANWT